MHQHTRRIRTFYSFVFASIFTLSFFSGVAPLHAQTIPGQSTGLTLVAEPSYPAPHTETIISIDDYSINTVGSTISWFINNVEQTKNINERSIKITTGDLGKSTNVRVALSRAGGSVLTTSLSLTPSQVDIILESDTYIPQFYKGRALPTRDSMMRATAVVHDGKATPDSSYVYQWSLDSTVLMGGQTKGKRTIDIQMPHYDNLDLFVEVYTSTGELIGRGAVLLLAVEPELHFYENSPLRGLSERELSSPFRLIGEEATIYGEPYFIDSPMRENDATFTWMIDYEPVPHDSSLPNALTLRKVGGAGKAEIDFSVVTRGGIPQFVQKAFQLIFD
ncbi:MAG: hypothetical protein WAW13_03200 [Minisyncoccia bacterium]